MPALLEKLLAPEEQELHSKKQGLSQLEAQLADRELDLAALLAELNQFERHYLQTIGRRYALLDELKAQIAEAKARRHPKNEEAREQAEQARVVDVRGTFGATSPQSFR